VLFAAELAVAGLVASQSLVGSKGFATNRTLVDQFRRINRRWRKTCLNLQVLLLLHNRGGGGGGAALSEHEEAESEVLFFRGLMAVTYTVALRALALSPWIRTAEASVILELKRRRRSGGRVQSFKCH
jgi:hypothetical protein